MPRGDMETELFHHGSIRCRGYHRSGGCQAGGPSGDDHPGLWALDNGDLNSHPLAGIFGRDLTEYFVDFRKPEKKAGGITID